jgi:hypothetical protein
VFASLDITRLFLDLADRTKRTPGARLESAAGRISRSRCAPMLLTGFKTPAFNDPSL